MLPVIHRANKRGQANHGWLQSHFSFSFAEYHNLDRMGFGALRVINDDLIAPQQGFDMHSHRNMEIVTLVIKGALEHKDSQGNHGIIHAGEIQYMSAGSGIMHSEYNPSDNEAVELFQIWIYPNIQGGTPCYAQQKIDAFDTLNHWNMLISGEEHDGAICIKQNATIKICRLQRDTTITLPEGKSGFARLLFVIEGRVHVADEILEYRDEMQLYDTNAHLVKALEKCHLLLFEVPL